MLKDDGQLAADGLRALVALIGTGSNLHLSRFDGSEDAIATQAFDFRTRWERAVRLMRERGIDALFLMKPTNLAYITGDGRPCALGLFTSSLDCVVSVPTCDYADVRARSAATDIRQFKNEEDMFHGFRDVIRELGLAEATIGLGKASSMRRCSRCSKVTSCQRRRSSQPYRCYPGCDGDVRCVGFTFRDSPWTCITQGHRGR